MNNGFPIIPLIRCMRPKQWTKNLLLFAGLVFAHHFKELEADLRVFIGFITFCVLSGVVYIINDIRDAEKDRRHPDKKNRPIASGELQPRTGLIAAGGLLVIALVVSILLGRTFFYAAAAYFSLNLLYSYALRRIVILDVFSISFGFVLRAIAGVEAIRPLDPDIPITGWFLMCAFFLALFLAVCKRRHEALLLDANGSQHRKVLDEYSPALLDQMVAVTTTCTILSYAMWTYFGQSGVVNDANMLYTLPFVVFGIFRYLYIVYKLEEGGAPEQVLLNDIPLLTSILAWGAVVLFLLF